MKFLVIDDSCEDRKTIANYIKEGDFSNTTIDESSDLEKGFKEILEKEYDAIILDLKLPKTNGLETVEKMLKFLDENNKDIPVIILTGLEDYLIGKKAFRLGVKDFLIKNDLQSKDLNRSLTFATYHNNLPKRKNYNFIKKTISSSKKKK